MPTFRPNTLYYGDNLTILRDFPPECVDLIYLDPPFNSNRSYNVLFKEDTGREAEAQVQAFEDTWHWGKANSATWEIYREFVARGTDDARLLEALVKALGHNDVTAYLTMMASRLVALRRVLKPTGSIYLHCDPTAGHYLKVLMDAVFGAVNFKNEIVWKRTHAHSGGRKFGSVHDILLCYDRSQDATWNTQHVGYDDDYVKSFFRFTDPDGRQYRATILTGSGLRTGSSGRPWRGTNPSAIGRHWAIPGYVRPLLGDLPSTDVQAALDKIDEIGRIIWPEKTGGTPSFKQYLDDMPGVEVQDVWTDIPPISSQAKERLGFPTQKPEALLRRIIEVSSNTGDIVLDPFCGCGTAVVAAHRLGRKWIGIDIAMVAVNVMRNRLKTTFPDDFLDEISYDGEPADEAAALDLARRDKYDFQNWVVDKLGGTPRAGVFKKGSDREVDGVVTFPEIDPDDPAQKDPRTCRVIIQVKGGAASPTDVRALVTAVQQEGAVMGVFVWIRNPTSEMQRVAADAGVYKSPSTGKSYPKIQIIIAGEIVHGKRVQMPPKRGLTQYHPAPRAKRGNQLMISEMTTPYVVGSGDSALPEPDSDSQDDEA